MNQFSAAAEAEQRFEVGAALLDVILPSNVAFVVGGVVGGYLANVWYGGREVQLQMTTVPKT